MRVQRISILWLALSLTACGGSGGSGSSTDGMVPNGPAAPALFFSGGWNEPAAFGNRRLEIDAQGEVVLSTGAGVPVGRTFTEVTPILFVSRDGDMSISAIMEPTKTYAFVAWQNGQGSVLVRPSVPSFDAPVDPGAIASATWVGTAAKTMDGVMAEATSLSVRVFENHTYEMRYGDGRFYGADQNLSKVIVEENDGRLFRSRYRAEGEERRILWLQHENENGVWAIVSPVGGDDGPLEYWVLARAEAGAGP